MTQKYHFELVSLKICPYVQRSVITLLHKKVPFDITYVELDNPPAWFNQISPLGQVPLLKVNGDTVLFESGVINEFLDEVAAPHLHPKDPLAKARERAWMEYGSELFREMYMMSLETDAQALDALKDEFFTDLARVEEALSATGPFFRGADFGLIDATYAPLFMRLPLIEGVTTDARWKKLARVNRWSQALLALPEVKNSVVPEFEQLYREYFRKKREA